MSSDHEDDDVGYGKPPKATRFKPGQSGNRRGRPKGSRNFEKELDDILNAKITVSENGRPQTVSTLKAALMRLTEKSLKGEDPSLGRFLTLARDRSAEKAEQTREGKLSAHEREILQRYVDGFVDRGKGEAEYDGG